MNPETRYAKSGEVHIAYQVVGDDNSLDLVYIPSAWHHVELNWENPPVARFLSRIATLSRLIAFDKRGTGMSDRVVGVHTLETRMDDIRAVMDAASSDRAVLFAIGDAGPLGALFAATYPDRVNGLILMNSTPRFVRAAEFPWLPSRGELEQRIDDSVRRWGEDIQSEVVRRTSPDATDEEVSGFVRTFRLSVSPGAVADYMRMNLDVDVCDILPSIRVPTLVLHRTELVSHWDVRGGRYLARRIPSARLVELPGRTFAPPLGDQEALFKEIERFLREIRDAPPWDDEPDRILATILFTDIVDATARAVELGDRAWRSLLEQHHEEVRRQLARFRGVELDTAGDGFFARFDGPARAIRCARAVVEGVGDLGLQVRAGLHTGECELLEGKVGGIAVHIAARVAGQARGEEVLVSSTVKDLVAGSGIRFSDRGRVPLKGVPGEWDLFGVGPD